MKINVYVNGEEICKLVRDLFWVEKLSTPIPKLLLC